MANITAERGGLADGMPRDERGYWRPEGGRRRAQPLVHMAAEAARSLAVAQRILVALESPLHDCGDCDLALLGRRRPRG